jgi:hypothetical protein
LTKITETNPIFPNAAIIITDFDGAVVLRIPLEPLPEPEDEETEQA